MFLWSRMCTQCKLGCPQGVAYKLPAIKEIHIQTSISAHFNVHTILQTGLLSSLQELFAHPIGIKNKLHLTKTQPENKKFKFKKKKKKKKKKLHWSECPYRLVKRKKQENMGHSLNFI